MAGKLTTVAIPYRTYADGESRLIYSKVSPDMIDLRLANAEGVLVHEWNDAAQEHAFRVAKFA